jgi:hypothetical protein
VSVFNFNAGENTLAFSLNCWDDEDDAEALMFVKDGHIVKCDSAPRQPLVYVNFLEVSPGNHPRAESRLYRGLGPIMLRIACELSVQRGYGGRVGLHSVANAEEFYRRLGFQTLACPNEYHELYLELDEISAEALLRDVGDVP